MLSCGSSGKVSNFPRYLPPPLPRFASDLQRCIHAVYLADPMTSRNILGHASCKTGITLPTLGCFCLRKPSPLFSLIRLQTIKGCHIVLSVVLGSFISWSMALSARIQRLASLTPGKNARHVLYIYTTEIYYCIMQSNFSAVQAQMATVEGQLSAKEDLGEALTPIDFDQLKIENRQLVDRLQACNAELLTLKTQQATVAKVPYQFQRQTKYICIESCRYQ